MPVTALSPFAHIFTYDWSETVFPIASGSRQVRTFGPLKSRSTIPIGRNDLLCFLRDPRDRIAKVP
jgi:hypothetical protein